MEQNEPFSSAALSTHCPLGGNNAHRPTEVWKNQHEPSSRQGKSVVTKGQSLVFPLLTRRWHREGHGLHTSPPGTLCVCVCVCVCVCDDIYMMYEYTGVRARCKS